jgi:hypothetical protein
MSEDQYIIADRWWTIDDCLQHPDYLFIYGDNDIHQGKGGQAIIRSQPNSLGVPTKKRPTNQSTSFYTDQEYQQNIQKIDQALAQIIGVSHLYKKIIFPKDGLGTGLAQLPMKAPKTYQYLRNKLNQLFGINYF